MPTNRGIDKEDVVHYTREYYAAIKRNEIVPFAETRVNLKIVIYSKVSQKKKNKYHILIHVESRKMVWTNFAKQK